MARRRVTACQEQGCKITHKTEKNLPRLRRQHQRHAVNVQQPPEEINLHHRPAQIAPRARVLLRAAVQAEQPLDIKVGAEETERERLLRAHERRVGQVRGAQRLHLRLDEVPRELVHLFAELL